MPGEAMGQAWVRYVPMRDNLQVTVQKIDRPTALARGFSVSEDGIVRRNIVGSANIQNFYMFHVLPGSVMYGGYEKGVEFLVSSGVPKGEATSLLAGTTQESDTHGYIDTGNFQTRYAVEDRGRKIVCRDIVLQPRFVKAKYVTRERFVFNGRKATIRLSDGYLNFRSSFSGWSPRHPHVHDGGGMCIGDGSRIVKDLLRASMYRSAVIAFLDIISVHNLGAAYGYFTESQSVCRCYSCKINYARTTTVALPSGYTCCPMCYDLFVEGYMPELAGTVTPYFIYGENGLEE